MSTLARLGLQLLLLIVIAGPFGTTLGQVPHSAEHKAEPAWQRVSLGQDDRRYEFPVFASHDLSGDLREIRQIVIVVHGLQRNGGDYFAMAGKLLARSGREPSEVLLIAPNFPGLPDKDKGFDGMPVWGVREWSGGFDAQGIGFALSSFSVLDDLLLKLTDRGRLPALGTIVVAGHSAGAQLVQRYAVLNPVDETIRGSGLDLRYVVANPSSYLYFNGLRPALEGFAEFDAALCPDFDTYRYGMKDMIPYADGANGQALFKRYSRRAVTYLLGSADNDPNHRVLDKSCPAQAQGTNRIARGRAYLRYERQLAGKTARIHHLAYEVTDVGHDQAGIFGSTCGLMSLFQADAPAAFRGARCRPSLF